MAKLSAHQLLARAVATTLAATAGLVALTITSEPAYADGPLACTVSNLRNDNINVRQQPTTTAGVVALLTPGDSAVSECHFHRWAINASSTYTCFSHPRDNTWVRVFEDGVFGYVGWRCVTGP